VFVTVGGSSPICRHERDAIRRLFRKASCRTAGKGGMTFRPRDWRAGLWHSVRGQKNQAVVALIASEALLAGGISLEEKGLINEPRR
jgi:hypothetical protein